MPQFKIHLHAGEGESIDFLAQEEGSEEKYPLGNLRIVQGGLTYVHRSDKYETDYVPEFCPELRETTTAGQEYFLRLGDKLVFRRKGETTGPVITIEHVGSTE